MAFGLFSNDEEQRLREMDLSGMPKLKRQLKEKTVRDWLRRKVTTESGNPLAFLTKAGGPKEGSIFAPRTVVTGDGAPMGVVKEVELIRQLPRLLKTLKRVSRSTGEDDPLAVLPNEVGIYAADNFAKLVRAPKELFGFVKKIKADIPAIVELRATTKGAIGQFVTKKQQILADPVKIPKYRHNTYAHELAHAGQFFRGTHKEKALFDWRGALQRQKLLSYWTDPIESHARMVGEDKDYADSLDQILKIIETTYKGISRQYPDPLDAQELGLQAVAHQMAQIAR